MTYSAKTKYPYWEVQEWCLKNIGEFNVDWGRLGQDPLAGLDGEPVYDQYFFAREKDMTLFLLRWS